MTKLLAIALMFFCCATSAAQTEDALDTLAGNTPRTGGESKAPEKQTLHSESHLELLPDSNSEGGKARHIYSPVTGEDQYKTQTESSPPDLGKDQSALSPIKLSTKPSSNGDTIQTLNLPPKQTKGSPTISLTTTETTAPADGESYFVYFYAAGFALFILYVWRDYRRTKRRSLLNFQNASNAPIDLGSNTGSAPPVVIASKLTPLVAKIDDVTFREIPCDNNSAPNEPTFMTWWVRYPAAIFSIWLLLSDSLRLAPGWTFILCILAILWMYEIALVLIGIGLAYLILGALAGIPTSIAIILGAWIIAGSKRK